MGITVISPTDEADANVLMNNFNYLDGKIDTTQTQVSTIETTFTTIVNNTLSVYQDIVTLGTSGTISLTENTVNKCITSGNVTFTLPSITDATKYYQILIFLHNTSNHTVTLGTSYYFGGHAINVSLTGYYDVIYEYDPITGKWYVGAVSKG